MAYLQKKYHENEMKRDAEVFEEHIFDKKLKFHSSKLRKKNCKTFKTKKKNHEAKQLDCRCQPFITKIKRFLP